MTLELSLGSSSSCVSLSMHHVQPLGSGCKTSRTQEVAEPENWTGPTTDGHDCLSNEPKFTSLVTCTRLTRGRATSHVSMTVVAVPFSNNFIVIHQLGNRNARQIVLKMCDRTNS